MLSLKYKGFAGDQKIVYTFEVSDQCCCTAPAKLP